LNDGNRYEINRNVEKVREMILDDWKIDGEIIEL